MDTMTIMGDTMTMIEQCCPVIVNSERCPRDVIRLSVITEPFAGGTFWTAMMSAVAGCDLLLTKGECSTPGRHPAIGSLSA